MQRFSSLAKKDGFCRLILMGSVVLIAPLFPHSACVSQRLQDVMLGSVFLVEEGKVFAEPVRFV